jgi:hypothetical protein
LRDEQNKAEVSVTALRTSSVSFQLASAWVILNGILITAGAMTRHLAQMQYDFGQQAQFGQLVW